MKIKPFILVPKTIKIVSNIIMQKHAHILQKLSKYATGICKALQVACVCAAYVVREQDSLKENQLRTAAVRFSPTKMCFSSAGLTSDILFGVHLVELHLKSYK